MSGWNNGMIVEMEYQLVDHTKVISALQTFRRGQNLLIPHKSFCKITSYISEKFPAQVSHLAIHQLNADVQILAAAASSIVNVWIRKISPVHQWHKIYSSDLASGAPSDHHQAAYIIDCLTFTKNAGILRLNAFLLGGYLW